MASTTYAHDFVFHSLKEVAVPEKKDHLANYKASKVPLKDTGLDEQLLNTLYPQAFAGFQQSDDAILKKVRREQMKTTYMKDFSAKEIPDEATAAAINAALGFAGITNYRKTQPMLTRYILPTPTTTKRVYSYVAPICMLTGISEYQATVSKNGSNFLRKSGVK